MLFTSSTPPLNIYSPLDHLVEQNLDWTKSIPVLTHLYHLTKFPTSLLTHYIVSITTTPITTPSQKPWAKYRNKEKQNMGYCFVPLEWDNIFHDDLVVMDNNNNGRIHF